MNVAERFWSKVDRRADDECWPWVAACDSSGYGVLKVEGRVVMATHLAITLAGGDERPPGRIAMHACDNPLCCNPAHLSWATQRENLLDRDKKGRTRHGSAHASARLTEAQVLEIRAKYAGGGVLQKDLASAYGVHPGTITDVLDYTTWRHVGAANPEGTPHGE